jgi:hypothetical protein
MKCRYCPKIAVDPFGDCDDCYEERKRRNASEYAKSLLKISTCDRCKVESMTSYHWCINCFNLWERNGRCFPENKPSTKYMFIDSDDEEDPVVTKEIPVTVKEEPEKQKITYIHKKVHGFSSICRWRCMESQLNNRCICETKYDHDRILLEIAQDKLKAFNDEQKVGFGKFRDFKWWDMMKTPETKSWSDWYIKNCNNKGEFYRYLVLAKEEDDLKQEMKFITNPFFD